MLLEKIPLGKTLEIYIDREGYRYRLVSKVEDTSERRVCVTLIAAGGRAFRFDPEDDIRLVYRDEEQMWEWPHVKAGIAKIEDVPVHYFEITNRGRSFNRRNAYRVSLNENVEIGYYSVPGNRRKYSDPVLPEETGEEMAEDVIYEVPIPEYVKGMIKNVSETGLGFYTDFEFDTEDGIFVEIPSDYGLLETKANVIRKDELNLRASNQRYRFYYGCVFSRADRRLIKMIYDIQRENLKRQRDKE